ncbi:hypothetical protein [Arthrobacter oryzae]|uniref:hypothetical protein n=1 Tax=Arthrobacter oryzae TaxID=409290 RepID=UPI00273CC1DF|nr:hypothetical protein [Arthrobacter oryzae]WLQ07469.1 hypothetical protein Q8Z05_04770 [Arthrobacter oryzae]
MTEDEQDRAEILENYRAQLEAMVDGDTARPVGRIITDATVYGARAKWPLQLSMDFIRVDGEWLASRSEATTW